MKIWLPRKFWDDHAERDLPSGEVVKLNSRRVLIEANQEEIDEIYNDAHYYSHPYGPLSDSTSDCSAWDRSLKRSAALTRDLLEPHISREERKRHGTNL